MDRRAFALITALLWATSVRAAESPLSHAREAFAHGEAEYAQSHWDKALARYEEAWAAKPLPGLLFNMAQCHRQLHHWSEAERLFRDYLDKQPAAQNRDDVESLIREVQLQQQLGQVRLPLTEGAPEVIAVPAPVVAVPAPVVATPAPVVAAAPSPPAAEPPPLVVAPTVEPQAVVAGANGADLTTSTSPATAARTPVYKRWYFWAAIGGVVAAGTATALALSLGGGSTYTPGSLATIDAR